MKTAIEQKCVTVRVGVLQQWYVKIPQGDERNADAYDGDQCAFTKLLVSSPGACIVPSEEY